MIDNSPSAEGEVSAAPPISESSNGHPPAEPSPLLLAARDAAALLGMSERAFRRADQTHKVPRPVRIGRNVRWRRTELEGWIDAECPDRETWEAMK